MGISDITVLLNAFYATTGLVTFHGDDLLWGFGSTPTDYDRGELVRTLMAVARHYRGPTASAGRSAPDGARGWPSAATSAVC